MIRNTFSQFMAGRNGNDHLNLGLLVGYVLLYFVTYLTGSKAVYTIALVLLVLAVLRFFSRNTSQRRDENAKFVKLIQPAVGWIHNKRMIGRDREHRYFKCPHCGQLLRVPRGRGNITVKCRNCGKNFQQRS